MLKIGRLLEVLGLIRGHKEQKLLKVVIVAPCFALGLKVVKTCQVDITRDGITLNLTGT